MYLQIEGLNEGNSNINKVVLEKLQSKIDQSHNIACIRIENDPTLSRLKKRYLKETSYRLCRIEVMREQNRLIDLKGMVENDILSRRMRDYYKYEDINKELDLLLPKRLKTRSLPKCYCVDKKGYCFCVDKFNKWIRL